MMRYVLVIVFLVACVTTTQAGTPPTTVFIDNGIIYGVSQDSILRSDPGTGEILITYSDGSAVYQQNQPLHSPDFDALLSLTDEPMWIHGSAPNRRGKGDQLQSSTSGAGPLSEPCAQEANALIAATQAMQAACSGDDAATCASAHSHYVQAESAYSSCMRHHLQER